MLGKPSESALFNKTKGDICFCGLRVFVMKIFYSKDWVLDIAQKNGKQVLFSQSENLEYWNSKYVFNCFIF